MPTRRESNRARYYRLKAEELRTAADGMDHAQARLTILRLADNYDRLADTMDGVTPPPSAVAANRNLVRARSGGRC
jgi:hypothetical protein